MHIDGFGFRVRIGAGAVLKNLSSRFMKQNQDYKNEALKALNGNWPQALVATIIIILIATVLLSPDMGNRTILMTGGAPIFPAYLTYSFSFLVILVLFPVAAGFSNSFRVLLETGDNRLTNNTFSLGFGNWLHVALGMFVMMLYISLWSLLLVIPGIIKAYSYAMTPYILVEHPELSINQAIDLSRKLMKGRKFDYFYLQLSFIGWYILSILTLGIGFLWLTPYIECAEASFYADVKADNGMDTVLETERVL